MTQKIEDRLDGLHDKVTQIGGKVETIAKLAGSDHDTITGMAKTMETLTSASTTTATGITVLATLGEKAEKRIEDAETKADERAGRRWSWFEENWKSIGVIVLLLGGVQADNIAPFIGAYFGAAPVAAQVVTLPAPVPAPGRAGSA